MKSMLVILALSQVLAIAGENPVPDPFAVQEPERSRTNLTIPKMDLKAGQSLQDAIQQIVEGLAPEERKTLIVDIPAAELGNLRIKRDLRVNALPLVVALKYLEQVAPIGFSRRHGVWHLSTERPDDVIAVEYGIRKSDLADLGIHIEPNGMLLTTSGRMWPGGSGEWKATYTAGDPDSFGFQSGVLRVLATRSFHDELEAVILLKDRGYDRVSLDK